MSDHIHINEAFEPDPVQNEEEEEEFTVLPAITKRGSLPNVTSIQVEAGQGEEDDGQLTLEPHAPSKVSFASNAKAEAELVTNGGRKRKAAVTVRSAYKQYGNGPE